MNTRLLPQELAECVMLRSTCSVQMGAVLADKHGILSWGWNHTKIFAPADCNGKGVHAEIHALSRANPKRVKGATIYVAGIRKRNRNPVDARPCSDCMPVLKKAGIKKVVFLSRDYWCTLHL